MIEPPALSSCRVGFLLQTGLLCKRCDRLFFLVSPEGGSTLVESPPLASVPHDSFRLSPGREFFLFPPPTGDPSWVLMRGQFAFPGQKKCTPSLAPVSNPLSCASAAPSLFCNKVSRKTSPTPCPKRSPPTAAFFSRKVFESKFFFTTS